ncbi:MAG: DUF3617 domain-containing protein [Alteraurantiacibacter sp.]
MAACTPDPPGEDQILASAASLPAPQPGLYRSTTRLTDYDLPQASPQEAAAMRARLGGVAPSVAEHCLTAADAEEGWLALVRGLNEGSCQIEQFSADGGEMAATVACSGPGDTTSRMAMTGTASAAASRMDLHIVQHGPAIPGGEQTIAMTVTNERIGECAAPAPSPGVN